MPDSVKAKAAAAPGIERAHTLSSAHYVDPATYRRECERIFWRTWQCVGWREQVANSGDYFTFAPPPFHAVIADPRPGE